MSLQSELRSELEHLEGSGLLRAPRSAREGALNFSSNDYLGLSSREEVVTAFCAAKRSASSSSRVMCGTAPEHHQLELQLAEYFGTPAALLFSAGYLVNLGVMSALVGRNDRVFADRLVHASLIDGIVLSRAKFARFNHNDFAQLEQQLTGASKTRKAQERWLIVVESLYSMDGDSAPLAELRELANIFSAVLVVDEAHAAGVFGRQGRGLAFSQGVRADITTLTLSKSFASYGGVALSDDITIRYLLQRSRPFIYNTSLPPGVCASALAALGIIQSEALGSRLLENARYFREKLMLEGLPVIAGQGQIVPVLVPGNRNVLEFAERLESRGVLATAVRAPTVQKGQERIRFSVTLNLSRQQLERAAEEVVQVWRSM